MFAEIWHKLATHPQFFAMLTIPFVTAIVTWAHVWMALKMLFYPIHFGALRFKDSQAVVSAGRALCHAKRVKISGILVDQTLSKLGSLDEFFQAMHPEEVADFISQTMNQNLDLLIDEKPRMSARQRYGRICLSLSNAVSMPMDTSNCQLS